MNEDRLKFLFGADALEHLDEYDLDDEAGRAEAIERFVPLPHGQASHDRAMARRTVAITQVLCDDPPEVWETVQRLQKAGLDRDDVLMQMDVLIDQHFQDLLASDSPFDTDSYVEDLASLPLPGAAAISRNLLSHARSKPGGAMDDLIDAVIESLGDNDGPTTLQLIDQELDDLLVGPLHLLPEDRVVVIADLFNNVTFTHRLSEVEAEVGVLSAGFDFGALTRVDTAKLADGTTLEQFSAEQYHLAWSGPQGWLEGFEPGDLLACTATLRPDYGLAGMVEASVTIKAIDEEPEVDSSAIKCVRAGYDELVAEPGLPVDGASLTWWLLFHHPELFATTQPPLSELCAAAGLEQRGGLVAHDEEVWRSELRHRRLHATFDLVADSRWRLTVGKAIGILDDPSAPVDEIRSILSDCAEPEAIGVLADVLFDHYLDLDDRFELGTSDATGHLFELVERATAAARKPREVATAEYLTCILYERCADPDTAERHLKRAKEAQPLLAPILDRIGRYRFDRGDAPGAMRSWSKLPYQHEGAGTIRPFLTPTTRATKLGRNDPCWCGSERKFKRCHQGSAELPALPDRVGWLCRKASLWLTSATGEARILINNLVWTYVSSSYGNNDLNDLNDDEMGDLVAGATADPIVLDAALQEGGLFNLFLRERGSLLPEDEQLLAASWQTIRRSVHEVLDVHPGTGITLRDLATGEVVEVREQTASTQVSVGERYCVRVVPDGASHQIIGGVFPVGTGHEETVLALCDEGDPVELCAWAGALSQPTQISHRPGLIDEMFDRDAIESVLSGLGDDIDSDDALALIQAEVSRQAHARWVDEHIPALGGITPREAAVDPTRREQLERLLADMGKRPSRQLPDGVQPFSYNINALRKELGLGPHL